MITSPKKKFAPALKSDPPAVIRTARGVKPESTRGFVSASRIDALAEELRAAAETHRFRFGGHLPEGLTADHRAFGKSRSQVAYRRRQRKAKRGGK